MWWDVIKNAMSIGHNCKVINYFDNSLFHNCNNV